MFTKNRMILIVGLVIALMPFLGFPYPYEEILYVCAGLFVAVLAFLHARHKRISKKVGSRYAQGQVVENQSPARQKEIVDSHPFSEEEVVEDDTVMDDVVMEVKDTGSTEKFIDETLIPGDDLVGEEQKNIEEDFNRTT